MRRLDALFTKNMKQRYKSCVTKEKNSIFLDGLLVLGLPSQQTTIIYVAM